MEVEIIGDDKIIATLAKENTPEYNWLKLSEELAELQEVVIKSIVKKGTPKEPPLEHVVEEMGDVILRMGILSKMLDVEDAVFKRMDYKLEMYAKYLKDDKYKGRI